MKTKSLLAWQGGKSRLAYAIVERMIEHTTYCEVFAGASWVLFSKAPSKAEIINDINRELVTLYRCVQHHLPALVEQFRWLLVAREEFDRFMATPAETLTDIQRAARFFYLMKTSFGARVRGPTFGATHTQPARLNLLRIEEDLSAAHLRLARVLVECRPWAEVIDRFDSTGTMFYLDPPYWGRENDYGLGLFSRDDFACMAEQLARVKGKFILSLNDTPGVREVFARFQIEGVKTRYSININSNTNDRGKAVPELLITNYR